MDVGEEVEGMGDGNEEGGVSDVFRSDKRVSAASILIASSSSLEKASYLIRAAHQAAHSSGLGSLFPALLLPLNSRYCCIR